MLFLCNPHYTCISKEMLFSFETEILNISLSQVFKDNLYCLALKKHTWRVNRWSHGIQKLCKTNWGLCYVGIWLGR